MKKTIIALLVVCFLAGAAIGYLSWSGQNAGGVGAEAPAAVETGTEPVTETGTEAGTESAEETVWYVPDYEAMYALHDPEEIVATVGGKDVSWGEYFYLYFSQAKQIENYFYTMQLYYGMSPAWSDLVEEDGSETYADIVGESADSSLRQIRAIELMAEENGVELSAEQQEEILAQEQQDIVSAVGEGGTEEDFNAYIETIYLPRSLYDRMNRVNHYYQNGMAVIYGENGASIADDEALQYLTDNGYMAAAHILLMTIDSATYEQLDEETAAAKKAQAEEIAAELQAIEDVQERMARFRELKEEYCEDSGKTAYPDGYIFLPGTMVTVFEDAVLALDEYQVSDPVLSDYGYHIIMRLPLDPDGVIEYASDGSALNARSEAANTAYGELLQSYYDALEITYAEGFRAPNLLAYLKPAEE